MADLAQPSLSNKNLSRPKSKIFDPNPSLLNDTITTAQEMKVLEVTFDKQLGWIINKSQYQQNSKGG